MATIAAKPGVIAFAMILSMCVAYAAASDSGELPVAFDILQRPAKEAASLGYGCFTGCFGGCFAAGFSGDYCSEFCSTECADDVRKLRNRLSTENAASVGDICNIPACIKGCVAAKIDAPYCTYWCEEMCGDDTRMNRSGGLPL